MPMAPIGRTDSLQGLGTLEGRCEQGRRSPPSFLSPSLRPFVSPFLFFSFPFFLSPSPSALCSLYPVLHSLFSLIPSCGALLPGHTSVQVLPPAYRSTRGENCSPLTETRFFPPLRPSHPPRKPRTHNALSFTMRSSRLVGESPGGGHPYRLLGSIGIRDELVWRFSVRWRGEEGIGE